MAKRTTRGRARKASRGGKARKTGRSRDVKRGSQKGSATAKRTGELTRAEQRELATYQRVARLRRRAAALKGWETRRQRAAAEKPIEVTPRKRRGRVGGGAGAGGGGGDMRGGYVESRGATGEPLDFYDREWEIDYYVADEEMEY